jgi:hypothetical protein
MRELADRAGIDLEASYAYSDSESDLPMLRAVRHAVVVNPDAELRRIAGEEGWEVLHLDRLGRRLKVLAAVGAVTALGGLGRVLSEHVGTRGDPRALQLRAVGPRREPSRRVGPRRRARR